MCTDYRTTYRECGHEIRVPTFCQDKKDAFTQLHLAAVARDEESPRPKGYMSREDETYYYRYDDDNICSVRTLADDSYFRKAECDYCMTGREARLFEAHLPFKASLPLEPKKDEGKKLQKDPKVDVKKQKKPIEQRPQVMRTFGEILAACAVL
ncbi:hypothetical protein IFR05_013672 [Cadophora sp. M221]|nr:hypothetical protein IFR05_013672 [Cadophora sp. M221]